MTSHRELFTHVDTALHLLAAASGDLGAAGTASFNDITQSSPLALLAPFKRFFAMRRAEKKLAQAKPHLLAIQQEYVESRSWLAKAPEPDAWSTALLELGGRGEGLLEVIIDGIIHDRIESQLVELNALLAEIGQLHLRLRRADPTLVSAI
ncbi:MAG: hypothetical protein SFX73_07100 [Kofleriaceae bacterium]|nr:hypothetical protein [Kofleriaceae bacterium]